jgi:hypothetical protein
MAGLHGSKPPTPAPSSRVMLQTYRNRISQASLHWQYAYQTWSNRVVVECWIGWGCLALLLTITGVVFTCTICPLQQRLLAGTISFLPVALYLGLLGVLLTHCEKSKPCFGVRWAACLWTMTVRAAFACKCMKREFREVTYDLEVEIRDLETHLDEYISNEPCRIHYRGPADRPADQPADPFLIGKKCLGFDRRLSKLELWHEQWQQQGHTLLTLILEIRELVQGYIG